MKPLRRLILAIFSLFIFISFGGDSFAATHPISDYETQIFSESNSTKVKGLQRVFTGLGLYKGSIDGKYSSIESDLLAYQKKIKLITNKQSYGAGYFGKKTFEKMEAEFGDRFIKLADLHLKKVEPKTGERYFVVTAYYSPLPGQSRYTTGSYAGDIRLNGGGKITASGKGVFPGLLAAPRNYKFGSKIYLDGIGVGSVEDRGGAIVNAGERGFAADRIDIWMGHGDEGLLRALRWGKRKVRGELIPSDTIVNVQFESSLVEKYRDLKVDAEKPENTSVKRLQELFKEIGLYSGDINGKFEDIRPILVEFQLRNKIIDNKNSYQAGYFGEKTLKVLRRQYGTDGIFRQPDDFTKENIAISSTRRAQLEKIGDILNNKINKKYKSNTSSKTKYKKKLQKNISNAIKKSKSSKRKNSLRYLALLLK